MDDPSRRSEWANAVAKNSVTMHASPMPKIDATTTKQAKSNVAVSNNTGTPPTSSTMLGYVTHDDDDGHLTHVV